jgi:hypothetical protein
LTDVYPFGERTDAGELAGLCERILTRRPVAPHLLNPRVPLAVSQVCMKLLAEWPAERYATVPELCAALQEALTQAENDATWEVPLVDPHDPQATTTLDDPERQEPDEVLRAFRKNGKKHPRRGLVRPKKALDLLLARIPEESPRASVSEVAQDRIPTVGAPREAVHAAGNEPPGEDRKPAISAPMPPAREQPSVAMAIHPRRAPWLLVFVAGLATVVVVGLSVSAARWGVGSSRATGKGQPEMMRPSPSSVPLPIGGSMAGHEVAPAAKLLESSPGEGAVPVGALPPAPTAHAMSRTPAQTTKNETPKPQTQRAGLRLPMKPATVAVATIAGCTLVEGCTTSTPQVRPSPPAITCPEGWKETHKRLHLSDDLNARVKDGPATLQTPMNEGLGNTGMPDDTLLFGTWQLGENRLFGTFTQAQIPGMGTLPVCWILRLNEDTGFTNEHGKEYVCQRGLGTCLYPGSKPGNARIVTRILLKAPAQ